MKKKRAPIEQLKEAGEIARKKLIERGLLSTENLVEKTAKEHPGLVLPGIPSYLPHKWTIKSSQRIMYDIIKMWQFSNKKQKKDRTENLASFIEFCIKEMNHQEEVAKKKMDTQGSLLKHLKKVPVLGKIFEPVNQYDAIRGVKKFFVDSFAVSIIINGQASTTCEFAEFFFSWTDKLYTIWERQDDKIQTNKISKN
jgi:hypothetical protein